MRKLEFGVRWNRFQINQIETGCIDSPNKVKNVPKDLLRYSNYDKDARELSLLQLFVLKEKQVVTCTLYVALCLCHMWHSITRPVIWHIVFHIMDLPSIETCSEIIRTQATFGCFVGISGLAQNVMLFFLVITQRFYIALVLVSDVITANRPAFTAMIIPRLLL